MEQKILDFYPAENKEEIGQMTQNIEKLNAQKKNPNNPMKASIYSAVLPGAGQYYNRKYWKIPIVWAAVGTSAGIWIWNQGVYNRYRQAYLLSLEGKTHEFSDITGVTKEVLGRTQDRFKRQRDYAIAITALVYVLNILDAAVDAHLYEQKKDPDLVFYPSMIPNEYTGVGGVLAFGVRYRF